MKALLSVYGCWHVRTIDGDSFICGGNVRPIVPDLTPTGWEPRVRLVHVDAPERGEVGWSEARTLLMGWLGQGAFNLLCYGRDKYGRQLADAERGQGLLSAHLLAAGAEVGVKPYTGPSLLAAE